MKKYAITTSEGATIVYAHNKKEASVKLKAKLKDVYIYN